MGELYAGATRVVQYARTRLADNRVSTIEEATTITVEVVPGWANGTVVTFKGMGHQLNAGTLAVPVPEITTSKDEKRIAGRGMPKGSKGPGYGDLIIAFDIGFPKELSGAQKEAIRQIIGA